MKIFFFRTSTKADDCAAIAHQPERLGFALLGAADLCGLTSNLPGHRREKARPKFERNLANTAEELMKRIFKLITLKIFLLCSLSHLSYHHEIFNIAACLTTFFSNFKFYYSKYSISLYTTMRCSMVFCNCSKIKIIKTISKAFASSFVEVAIIGTAEALISKSQWSAS